MTDSPSQSEQVRTAALRCAMFIDFDNVYIGLKALDADAAEAFATDPSGWLARLERGVENSGEAFRRRFSLRACYLNPSVFARYRPFFTRAGFRVVDCPSLTRMGKSGADINLVLDAVDALASSTRYDEFVILSGDADFTPLALRFREADRRVTLVTASPAASPYRAVADTVVNGDALADLVSTPASAGSRQGELIESSAEPVGSMGEGPLSMTSARTSGMPRPQQSRTGDHTKSAVAAAAVQELLESASQPLSGGAVAQCALRSCPSLSATAWDSHGTFAHWLVAMVPQAGYSNASGGYVWDVARFSEADIPGSRRRDDGPLTTLQRQVVSITETPAQALGTSWASNVAGLCRAARMELDAESLEQLTVWVSGGLATALG